MKSTLICLVVSICVSCVSAATNLTCYQCKRTVDEECGPEDLKACPSIFDRCAIHISNNEKYGFSIKRECGLGPCTFDDEMSEKSLGMNCDRSKSDYFCTYCCKENGCNKNEANTRNISSILIILAFVFVCLLNVARDFIPPYVMSENTGFKK